MRTLVLKILALLTLLLTPLTSSAEIQLNGPKVPVGQGWAASTISLRHGKVQTVGIMMTGNSLEGLPDIETEFILDLPPALFLPPYDHFVMNWNPHGHEPAGVYDVPHFDFHFYFISKEEVHNILCDGTDDDICLKRPDADHTPPYYVPGPAGVPMMGWHWIDPRSPEFNGKPFTATFIYGFYSGKMIFVEPMVTLDFLKNHSSTSKDIPVPKAVAKAGYYPTKYSVYYNAVTDMLLIVLNKMTWLNEKAAH